MITLTYSGSSIYLPDPQLGDREGYDLPHNIGKRDTSYPVRYVDDNWKGFGTYDHVFLLPKCHATFSTYAQVRDWLVTNTGQLCTWFDGSLTRSVFVTVTDMVEQKEVWSFSLRFTWSLDA